MQRHLVAAVAKDCSIMLTLAAEPASVAVAVTDALANRRGTDVPSAPVLLGDCWVHDARPCAGSAPEHPLHDQRPASTAVKPHALLVGRDKLLRFSLAVVDTDPKSATKLARYHTLDREIAQFFAAKLKQVDT